MTRKGEMHWLQSHLGTLDDARELAKQFSWKIAVVERDGIWYVLDGEAKIFSSTDREQIDAFLYGLGLAYASIPEPYHSELKQKLAEWLETL